MTNRQLSKRLSLIWSHSLITFMYENANTTIMLIQDHYLTDITNLWIENEWKFS